MDGFVIVRNRRARQSLTIAGKTFAGASNGGKTEGRLTVEVYLSAAAQGPIAQGRLEVVSYSSPEVQAYCESKLGSVVASPAPEAEEAPAVFEEAIVEDVDTGNGSENDDDDDDENDKGGGDGAGTPGADSPEGSTGAPVVWTEETLRALPYAELKAKGTELGSKSRSIDDLVNDILTAQAATAAPPEA